MTKKNNFFHRLLWFLRPGSKNDTSSSVENELPEIPKNIFINEFPPIPPDLTNEFSNHNEITDQPELNQEPEIKVNECNANLNEPNRAENMTNNITKPVSRISLGQVQEFLERDFFTEGFQDGYKFHNVEVRNEKVKRIVTEFRTHVRIRMEDIENEKLRLEQELINLADISEISTQRLQKTLEHLHKKWESLQNELALSVDHEGFVSHAVHAYVDGFRSGVEQWMGESTLLNGYSLFNNPKTSHHDKQ